MLFTIDFLIVLSCKFVFLRGWKNIRSTQLLTYHSHLLRQEEVPNSIQDAIKTDVMKLVPLARRLMQITLTLPVTSNEAAERCFQKWEEHSFTWDQPWSLLYCFFFPGKWIGGLLSIFRYFHNQFCDLLYCFNTKVQLLN